MKHLFVIIIISFIASSCQKETMNDIYKNTISKSSLLDSIYYYANEIYYWNEYIPEMKYITNKRISNLDTYESINNELINITSYAINPVTNKPFEYLKDDKLKYSIFTEAFSNSEFNNKGFGITFCTYNIDDIRVQYVIKGSPAYNKGIKRGMKLLSINRIKAKSNETFYSHLNNVLKEKQINIEISIKNSVKQIQLNAENIIFNPILKDTILTIEGSNIGYISYLSFQNSLKSMHEIADIFFKIERSNVDKLILDLRYNQGGYISTVDYFANALIPLEFDGKTMRIEEYNKTMQENKATILKNQIFNNTGDAFSLYDYDYSTKKNTVYFNKTSSLTTIKEICFIISNQTASASELLINILKPFMSIKTVGVGNRNNIPVYSYGKPVGSIGINIANYTFYLPMFKNLNSQKFGDYFNGMKADESILDDLENDFGCHEESAFYKSLELMSLIKLKKSKKSKSDQHVITIINTIEQPHILIKDCF